MFDWKKLCLTVGAVGVGSCLFGAPIDNSALLPKIVDDSAVKMETTADGTATSPEWVKDLIFIECYVGSASPDGKFSGMGKVLDHVAETGANAIWLTPVNEGYQYGNHGIHTLNSGLTGEQEIPRRWEVIRNFVRDAHKRNIRVFLDVVTWGVDKRAPLLNERPDWFTGPIPRYRGFLWDWDNAELNEWYASRLVDLVMMTGADGVRADCAPFYAMYKPYRVAKERLRQMGRKVVFISEHASARFDVFDFDQVAFVKADGQPRWNGDVYLQKNIVDMIRSGEELPARDMDRPHGEMRYYSFMLSSHDSKEYVAKGSPIAFGYQMILSPYLPIWYIGEEWNNAYSRIKPPMWLFANDIDWKQKDDPAKRAFFEQNKKMIRIRRQHPDIFTYFPDNHRESNICKVDTDRKGLLQAYARFRNGKAILVVPNNSKETLKISIMPPYEACGISGEQVKISDLLREQAPISGRKSEVKSFKAEIPAGNLGVFLVETES